MTSPDYNRVHCLKGAISYNADYLHMNYPDVTIYDSCFFKIEDKWIVEHPKEYQTILVDCYINLSTVPESKRNDLFDQLMKAIDEFVGYLNDKVPF